MKKIWEIVFYGILIIVLISVVSFISKGLTNVISDIDDLPENIEQQFSTDIYCFNDTITYKLSQVNSNNDTVIMVGNLYIPIYLDTACTNKIYLHSSFDFIHLTDIFCIQPSIDSGEEDMIIIGTASGVGYNYVADITNPDYRYGYFKEGDILFKIDWGDNMAVLSNMNRLLGFKEKNICDDFTKNEDYEMIINNTYLTTIIECPYLTPYNTSDFLYIYDNEHSRFEIASPGSLGFAFITPDYLTINVDYSKRFSIAGSGGVW